MPRFLDNAPSLPDFFADYRTTAPRANDTTPVIESSVFFPSHGTTAPRANDTGPVIEASVLPPLPDSFDPQLCPARIIGCNPTSCAEGNCRNLGNRLGIDVSK